MDMYEEDHAVVPANELNGENGTLEGTFIPANAPVVLAENNDEPVPPADLNYETVMAYVQTAQIGFVQKIAKGGIPTDKEGAKLFLDGLNALSSTATQKRRNEIDANLGESNQAIAAAMAEAVRNHMQNQSPFIVDPGQPRQVVLEEAPEGLLDQFEPADGETHIGVVAETSEEFNKRMEVLMAESEGKEE